MTLAQLICQCRQNLYDGSSWQQRLQTLRIERQCEINFTQVRLGQIRLGQVIFGQYWLDFWLRLNQIPIPVRFKIRCYFVFLQAGWYALLAGVGGGSKLFELHSCTKPLGEHTNLCVDRINYIYLLCLSTMAIIFSREHSKTVLINFVSSY